MPQMPHLHHNQLGQQQLPPVKTKHNGPISDPIFLSKGSKQFQQTPQVTVGGSSLTQNQNSEDDVGTDSQLLQQQPEKTNLL